LQKTGDFGGFSWSPRDEMRGDRMVGLRSAQVHVSCAAPLGYIFLELRRTGCGRSEWNRKTESGVLFSKDMEADDAN